MCGWQRWRLYLPASQRLECRGSVFWWCRSWSLRLMMPAPAGVVGAYFVTADICAVVAHRAVADWRVLRRLFPWVALGMAVGLGVLAVIPAGANVLFAAGLGWMVLLMAALQLLRQRKYCRPHVVLAV